MITALLLLAASLQQHDSCPMHGDGSAQHGKEVDARHDTFGMHHAESAHAFPRHADGGAIELRANRAGDAKTIAAIRAHLQQIVEQFRRADFSTPQFVHGYPPSGVATMRRLKADIAYRYQPLPNGGRIRITAKSAEALAAVHHFLEFQVTEHRTAEK